VPNKIPLDQLNPLMAGIRDAWQRRWPEFSIKMPLDDIDEADEDTLNRVNWHAARGRDDTYPAWVVLPSAGYDEEEERK
jgi:hypothetical protein